MQTLHVRPANAQHKGTRESQQDAFGFSSIADTAFAQHGGHLAVLADGMGGLENGAWASTHAVRVFIDSYSGKSVREPIDVALLRALRTANALVFQEANRLGLVERMGSTLVAAVIHDATLHWISTGDSRVYVFETGQLLCLSTDHSYGEVLQQKVVRGEISATEAQTHPLRNALTSHLGRPEPLTIGASVAPIRLTSGAWVMLCSDGLSGVLNESEIKAQLYGDPRQACDRLLQAAIGRGLPNQDNTTVVILHLPERNGAPLVGSLSRANYASNHQAVKKSTYFWNSPQWFAGLAIGSLALATLLALRWLPTTPPGDGVHGIAVPIQTPGSPEAAGTLTIPIIGSTGWSVAVPPTASRAQEQSKKTKVNEKPLTKSESKIVKQTPALKTSTTDRILLPGVSPAPEGKTSANEVSTPAHVEPLHDTTGVVPETPARPLDVPSSAVAPSLPVNPKSPTH